MSPAEAEFFVSALKWLGGPIVVSFIAALGAHLVMVFRLPGKLTNLTRTLRQETEAREREMKLIREDQKEHREWTRRVIDELKDILGKHSEALSSHGESIAALAAGLRHHTSRDS